MEVLLLEGWLFAVNAVGFVLALADKAQARRAKGRVPEAAFHAAALLGGWPGTGLAFLLVRHKTRKVRFLAVFALCALASLVFLAGVLGWWPR